MIFRGNKEISEKLGLKTANVDMHSHILPEFDDGARDLEETLELCHEMVRNNYEAVIWTPHYNIPSFPKTDPLMIRKHFEKYAPLIEIKTGLKVFMGSELYCRPPIPEELVPLAGTDFVLIEFPYDTYPQYLDEIIYNIQLKGYRIIFAHVERYTWLFPEKKKLFKRSYDYTLIERLKEKNIYFQVNQTTLENPVAFPYMQLLYQKNYIEFVGSDKHRREDRRTLVNFNE